MIEIIRVGGYATIQDDGRKGTRRLGIPPGGFMDRHSAKKANLSVGNDPNAALIELFHGELEFRTHTKVLLGMYGGAARIEAGGRLYKSDCVVATLEGMTIRVGALEAGLILYIAAAGGVITDMQYGSCSTYPLAGLGGNGGRPLAKGDILEVGADTSGCTGLQSLEPARYYAGQVTIRYREGPEHDWLGQQGRSLLDSETFTVAHTSRVGYRLKGPCIRVQEGRLTSRFVTRGTVQLPPDGHPIVLCSDAQTIGGYPRIGQVYEPDMDYFVQMKPGSGIRFRRID